VGLLGVLVTAFFTLLWRRLDKIDTRLDLIQKDQREFYGITQKLEGRVDEISHRVK
jgi:hypothetical protein